MKTFKKNPCGNAKCQSKQMPDGTMTFGTGEEYMDGHFSYPCRICAREYGGSSFPPDGRYTDLDSLKILKDKISDELGLGGELPPVEQYPVIITTGHSRLNARLRKILDSKPYWCCYFKDNSHRWTFFTHKEEVVGRKEGTWVIEHAYLFNHDFMLRIAAELELVFEYKSVHVMERQVATKTMYSEATALIDALMDLDHANQN